jgi:hypothetical protein
MCSPIQGWTPGLVPETGEERLEIYGQQPVRGIGLDALPKPAVDTYGGKGYGLDDVA